MARVASAVAELRQQNLQVDISALNSRRVQRRFEQDPIHHDIYYCRNGSQWEEIFRNLHGHCSTFQKVLKLMPDLEEAKDIVGHFVSWLGCPSFWDDGQGHEFDEEAFVDNVWPLPEFAPGLPMEILVACKQAGAHFTALNLEIMQPLVRPQFFAEPSAEQADCLSALGQDIEFFRLVIGGQRAVTPISEMNMGFNIFPKLLRNNVRLRSLRVDISTNDPNKLGDFIPLRIELGHLIPLRRWPHLEEVYFMGGNVVQLQELRTLFESTGKVSISDSIIFFSRTGTGRMLWICCITGAQRDHILNWMSIRRHEFLRR